LARLSVIFPLHLSIKMSATQSSSRWVNGDLLDRALDYISNGNLSSTRRTSISVLVAVLRQMVAVAPSNDINTANIIPLDVSPGAQLLASQGSTD